MSKNKMYELLKEVVDWNYLKLNAVDGDQNAVSLITLYHEEENVQIFDPFMDSTLRYDVDPIDTYGEAGVQQMINEYFIETGK